jgi:hypothetical protein
MQTIKITRQGTRWFFDAGAAGAGHADSLDMVTRRASQAAYAHHGIGPGQSMNLDFEFDESLKAAMAIGKDRARLKREADELEVRTRAEVVRLADDLKIGMRDIATLLGISSAKVSQIRTPGQVYVTDPESDEINVVDLYTKTKGVLTRYGRGPLPSEIEFEREFYVPTGGAHSIGGDAMKHSYIPRD